MQSIKFLVFQKAFSNGSSFPRSRSNPFAWQI